LSHCQLRRCALQVFFLLFCFFFFQAEDGIRDFHVTGVQTCALPIFVVGVWLFLQKTKMGKAMRAMADNMDLAAVSGIDTERMNRSEERRVGKECRSRW